MEKEIAIKIRKFLLQHKPFLEECHVVYLMVEIRKILEHIDSENEEFPLLKFYCDWVLHTDKSHKNKNWTYIIDMLDEGIKLNEEGKYTVNFKGGFSFFYGKPLKFELVRFCRKMSIPFEFVNSKEWWRCFQLLLFNVLQDQPIIKPTKNVLEIRYIKVEENMFTLVIEFTDNRGRIPFDIPI